jgi:mono/diheme cytochrome c family protein
MASDDTTLNEVIIMKWPRERPHMGSRLLSVLAFSCLVLASTRATRQTAPKPPEKTKAELEQLIYSVKGPELFRAHCAACHGSDAKGGGPMAPALKTKVPDLTVLAKKNGGQFPSARVRHGIMGDDVVLSHGSREMPIWGPIFHQIESDQDFGIVRLQNLLKYLESIQEQ